MAIEEVTVKADEVLGWQLLIRRRAFLSISLTWCDVCCGGGTGERERQQKQQVNRLRPPPLLMAPLGAMAPVGDPKFPAQHPRDTIDCSPRSKEGFFFAAFFHSDSDENSDSAGLAAGYFRLTLKCSPLLGLWVEGCVDVFIAAIFRS